MTPPTETVVPTLFECKLHLDLASSTFEILNPRKDTGTDNVAKGIKSLLLRLTDEAIEQDENRRKALEALQNKAWIAMRWVSGTTDHHGGMAYKVLKEALDELGYHGPKDNLNA